jgi:hypothetical protein
MATRRVLKALVLAGVSFCLLCISTPASYADSYARIVRLSDIEGSVQIDRNTGQGFEKAIQNMPITQGVRLQTGMTGRAEVEFENGTSLRLAENSEVEFSQLSLRSEGQRVSEVRVNDGTVYVNYKEKGDDEFRLDFAHQSVALDRDVHFRLLMSNDNAQIAVIKGQLELRGNGESAKVKKNETFRLDLNDGARYELAKGISPLDSDEWDAERNQYETQYASNYNSRQYPYQYGYSDLNYYGGFFDAPGYGSLWRPYGVGIGWDPFADGAWALYPGYGYMWVSSYPWGWTPYRYGSWIYVPNYGWGWQPGAWNQWNRTPVVVNPPVTWRRPLPPPSSSGSTVVVGRPPVVRPPRAITTDTITGRPIPGNGISPATTFRPDRAPNGRTPGPATANDNGATTRPAPPGQGLTQTQQHTTVAPPNTTVAPPNTKMEASRPSRGTVNLPQGYSKTQELQVERGGRETHTNTAPKTSPNPAPPASRSVGPAPTPHVNSGRSAAPPPPMFSPTMRGMGSAGVPHAGSPGRSSRH